MAKVAMPQRVQSTSRELNDAQGAIHGTLRNVVEHEQLTGRLVQSLSVTSSGTTIAHGLGRTPIGWHLSDVLDHGTVKRAAWDSKTITLQASAGTIRCDIFVW